MEPSTSTNAEEACPWCKSVYPLKSMKMHIKRSGDKCEENMILCMKNEYDTLILLIDDAKKKKKKEKNKEISSDSQSSVNIGNILQI